MSKLPELAQAVSLPLAKTERVILASDEQGAGASRVTNDIIQVISQLPPMVKSLTGVDITELISKIPELQKSEISEENRMKISEA